MTQLVLQGRAVNQTSSFGKPLAQRISGSCVFSHLLLISDVKTQKREIAAGVVFRDMREQILIVLIFRFIRTTLIMNKAKCDRLDTENSQQQRRVTPDRYCNVLRTLANVLARFSQCYKLTFFQ